MPSAANEHNPINTFLAAVPWKDYTGASFAFAAWRHESVLHNVSCRIVLRAEPPSPDWQFSDDVEELAIRRGWMLAESLRDGIDALRHNQIVLGGDVLTLTRDHREPYAWTHLAPGSVGRRVIGWRAPSLHGLGENQQLLLGRVRIARIDARLRVASVRAFSGWGNLAAFLGEGEEPFELIDRANTLLELFAPIYARIEPETSLGQDGALDVRVRCLSTIADPPLRLLLDAEGAAPPRALHLDRGPEKHTWRSTAHLGPSIKRANLSLMLGYEVADEFTLRNRTNRDSPPPSDDPSGQPSSPPPHKGQPTTPTPGEARSRLLRRALALLGLVIASVATIAGFRTNIASLFAAYLGISKPDVDLAWLDVSQSPPRIGESISLDPDNIDAETGRLRLPLLLAIRNKESRPLRLESVEVSVGDTIQLRSPSLAKVEPGRFVREHQGAMLQPSTSFLPLGNPDTLILPIRTATMGWLLLSDKKMPILFPWVVAARETSLSDTTLIPVDVSLYFDGRPKYSERMQFRVPPLLDPRWPRGRAVVRASAADRERFIALESGAGQDRALWSEVYPPTGDTVSYRRTLLNRSGYQAFYVDRVLRYVEADTNADGFLDFELLDVDGDGRVDYRALTRGWSRHVVLWGPEVVRVNRRVNRRALLYMAHRINEMVR